MPGAPGPSKFLFLLNKVSEHLIRTLGNQAVLLAECPSQAVLVPGHLFLVDVPESLQLSEGLGVDLLSSGSTQGNLPDLAARTG